MSRNNKVIQDEDGYDECPGCFKPVMPGETDCPFCNRILEEFNNND